MGTAGIERRLAGIPRMEFIAAGNSWEREKRRAIIAEVGLI